MKKKSISKTIFDFFLLISIVAALQIPCLYNTNASITKYINAISLISFIFLFIFIKKISLKNFGFYLVFYYILLCISSCLRGVSISYAIKEMIIFVFPILIINSLSKEKFNNCLGTILFAYEILTYINLLTIIAFPNGLYNIGFDRKYYFLGHVNIAIRYILPGSCISLIYSFIKKDKMTIRSYIYIISSIITLLITWPATAIAGYTIFLALISIMIKYKRTSKILNPFNAHIACIITSYLIIVTGIQKKFNKIIVGILHKDLTFTGRTVIWDQAIKTIRKNILFGYGRLEEESRRLLLNGVSSTHNQYLNIVFEGGIISLLFFMIMFYILKSKIFLCNNHKIVSVLSSAIISYAVMWMFEPFSYSGTFGMFLIFAITYKSSEYFNI